MPVYEIEAPDGRIFEVEAPDGATEQQVFDYFKSQDLGQFQDSTETPTSPAQLATGGEPQPFAEIFQGLPAETVSSIREEAVGGRKNEFRPDVARKLADYERLRLANPDQFAALESPSNLQVGPIDTGVPLPQGVNTFLTGVGKGMSDIGRAVGVSESSEEQRARDKIITSSGSGTAGEIVGQSAPFLPAGLLAGGVKSLVGRAAAMGAVGGTEGGTIAAGTGKGTDQIFAMSLLGGVLGAGSEVALPAIRRFASNGFRKATGRAPKGELLDKSGQPTPELQKALDSGEITQEQLAQEVQEQAAESTAKGFSGKGTPDIDGSAVDQGRIQSANELGIPVSDIPTGVISSDDMLTELNATLAAVPSSRARQELTSFQAQINQKSNDLIEDLGGRLDINNLSDEVLEGMQNNINASKAVESKLYDQVRQGIGEGTLVNTEKLRNKLAARARTLRGRGLQDAEKEVYDLMKQGKVSYAAVDDLRKKIGRNIGQKQGDYGTGDLAKLDELYGDLTRLQEGVAKTMGVDYVWSTAKSATKGRKRIEETTQALYGKGLTGSLLQRVEGKLKAVPKGGLKAFRAMMEDVPEKQRPTIVASALKGVMSPPGGGRDKLSVAQFNKWYTDLKQSGAFKEVMSYAPEGTATKLDALHDISKGLQKVQSAPRTGVISAAFDNLDAQSQLTGIMNRVRRIIPGSEPVNSLADVIMSTSKKNSANEVADSVLTSSQFKRALQAAAKNGTNSQSFRRANEALKKTKTYKKYIEKANRSRVQSGGTPFSIAYILNGDSEE